MKLSHKTILIISPESWGSIFVSKHHYASELSAIGNRVFFLNPPGSKNAVNEVQSNLWTVDYKPIFRGLHYLPSKVASYFTMLELRRIEKLVEVKFDIIWNFDASRFYMLRHKRLNSVSKIGHIVDLNQDLRVKELAQSVDICFCTTDLIREKLEKFNPEVHLIHHGYASSLVEKEIHLPGKQKIKALYVGNLASKWLDWEILLKCAEKHDQVDFIFIGPEADSNLGAYHSSQNKKELLKALDNVSFHPAIPFNEISSYLKSADILLVCYKEEFHEDAASPHKFMDYFASGKLIISTYTDAYKQMTNMFVMTKKNEEYVEKFGRSIGDLKELNSPNSMQVRINYAHDNTYKKQLMRIEEKLNTH